LCDQLNCAIRFSTLADEVRIHTIDHVFVQLLVQNALFQRVSKESGNLTQVTVDQLNAESHISLKLFHNIVIELNLLFWNADQLITSTDDGIVICSSHAL
jgi:hypothetical protein